MSSDDQQPKGPDLSQGIPTDQVAEGGCLAGHVNGESVMLARANGEWFAIGAACSHYSGPLPEGLIVGDTVRCPWHHACFSLRTGKPVRPPALRPVGRWNVEERDGRVRVTGKAEPRTTKKALPNRPASVAIIGGGAAGDAAAATLRDEGYEGPITIVDSDALAPYDRPNCSKDYLAGNAPEEWLPLRDPDYDRDAGIARMSGRRATELRLRQQEVVLDDGRVVGFGGGSLLLATGATPVQLDPATVGSDAPVYYLRTLADSRAIIRAAGTAKRVVVLGASFIGLEVAASLRARGLEVHVVAPDPRPLQRVMGPELGDFIRGLHEEHGVTFHLQSKAGKIGKSGVVLETGEQVAADFVVAGIGVRPNLDLASAAGLAIDKGVVVNERLETSVAAVFAAGDIARWPDARTGDRIRVEHWVVAQRQGQTAARNILGLGERFDAVPFFWSQHYDVPINYVGHAERWDRTEVDGTIGERDCVVRFRRGNQTLAAASIYRDRESLEIELGMEREAAAVGERGVQSTDARL
jgi:NADPH-dependent 2,4-dienoyl-CoA reductase/sulfur reductase-like enzyme/nitrite reductase/ring-hydroxylating ferredoxin subunit